jgi:hypothetical protein
MSDENEVEVSEGTRFSSTNVERIGWGLFIIFVGVSFYAEELHRIKDSWDQISLYGGGFLVAYWVVARLINRSLSYGMLVVGSILVTAWVFDEYDLNLKLWPLFIIIAGIAMLVKAFTDKRG